ncbi:hypothetical protein NERG_00157 [Nematocida ausubeli]|uniref:Uncharacterized protein n=1 Tax=Nematocida ausubeli (strain ATCC PRA-371 / ERTm2) TaxID=1913371 RepID=H8Z986_NEMA1|nr:hypothetical protein NERG_00157 [Nematocida ausubeli]
MTKCIIVEKKNYDQVIVDSVDADSTGKKALEVVQPSKKTVFNRVLDLFCNLLQVIFIDMQYCYSIAYTVTVLFFSVLRLNIPINYYNTICYSNLLYNNIMLAGLILIPGLFVYAACIVHQTMDFTHSHLYNRKSEITNFFKFMGKLVGSGLAGILLWNALSFDQFYILSYSFISLKIIHTIIGIITLINPGVWLRKRKDIFFLSGPENSLHVCIFLYILSTILLSVAGVLLDFQIRNYLEAKSDFLKGYLVRFLG